MTGEKVAFDRDDRDMILQLVRSIRAIIEGHPYNTRIAHESVNRVESILLRGETIKQCSCKAYVRKDEYCGWCGGDPWKERRGEDE